MRISISIATRSTVVVLALALLATVFATPLPGDEGDSTGEPAAVPYPEHVDMSASELRGHVVRFAADLGNLERFHDLPLSGSARERKAAFFRDWLEALRRIDFDALGLDGRIDYTLLRVELEFRLHLLEREASQDAEIAELLPFAGIIVELEQARRQLEPIEARHAAERLKELAEVVTKKRAEVAKSSSKRGDDEGEGDARPEIKRSVANRAARRVERLLSTLRRWHRFRDGYDPGFSWWTAKPFERATAALESYRKFLREKLVGVGADDKRAIIGDPIGREALMAELAHELIPYTPEELIEIGKRQLEWCDREMARAARDLGFGDDWRAAQEHVKGLHVDPGKQPELIRDLAIEATRFLEERDLVTIPQLCRETWRMEMMSAERQLVNPYFTGGEVISVSFPTDEMDHEDKLMSMRGNNVHFSRATVHHELIPGHHLQGYMASRYRTHRRIFRTPFLVEGWALYWELLLWDLDFARSPADRVGMLFWRKHRCARIIFSLSFHLERMTAEECVEFLVDRVGHERRNAMGEVRRSVIGGYSPLYQCAYLLGGLQLRALRRELVGPDGMTDREFHDAVLHENSIPIELIRASLRREPPGRDFKSTWRFLDE